MKKTTIITSLCAVALMSGAFVAQADARPHMGDRNYNNIANISAEDQAKLSEMGQAFAKKTEPLYFELEDKNYQLKKEYRNDSPNQAAIDKLQAEISDLRVKIFQEREAFRAQMSKEFPSYSMDHMGGMQRGMMRGGIDCYNYDGGNYHHDNYRGGHRGGMFR